MLIRLTKSYEKKLDANRTRSFPADRVYEVDEETGLDMIANGAGKPEGQESDKIAAKAAKKPAAGAEAGKDEPDFDKMTKAELEAYVDEHNIDIGDAKTKADIVEAIEASRQA